MRPKHPDPAVEAILLTLEKQGVDPAVIEDFAKRAADRKAVSDKKPEQ